MHRGGAAASLAPLRTAEISSGCTRTPYSGTSFALGIAHWRWLLQAAAAAQGDPLGHVASRSLS